MPDSGKPISMYDLVYDWAKYANQDLGKSLTKKHIGVTGALSSSLKFSLIGPHDDVQKVKFSFLNYGKFSDMGVGRGQKLGDIKGNKTIYKETGVHGRKATKWFSKVIFPEANTLGKLLAVNYGLQISNEINESFSDSVILSI